VTDDRRALLESFHRRGGSCVASWPADASGIEVVQIAFGASSVPLIHLYSVGASDRPMNVPHGAPAFVEFVCTLPPAWRLDPAALADEGWAWPLRWLHMLAAYSAQTNGWLGNGHSVPLVARPYGFDAVGLFPPVTQGQEASTCFLPSGKRVDILAVYPIYERERQFAMSYGSSALWERLIEGPMDILEPGRGAVC
jgi:hypothetical protein